MSNFAISSEEGERSARTFMCAVDGSPAADIGYETALQLLQGRDHLCLTFAYSAERDAHLPQEIKSAVIMDKYETSLLEKLPNSRFSFRWEHRLARSVKTLLATTVENVKPDFLVIGYNGRKAYNNESRLTTCGSNADFTMRMINVSLVIVKNPLPAIARPKTFLYCIKNSDLSKGGLEKLLSLVSPIDIVTVLYADDDSMDNNGVYNLDTVRTYYKDVISEISMLGPDSFKVVKREEPYLMHTLVKAVNAMHPDFCCIAPRQSKEFTDSMAQHIVLNVRSNIILLR